MAYPTTRPSSRTYTPGDWAVKRYNAMSGAEVRIRYGDKRFDARFALSYTNIPDAVAEQFLLHYDQQLGTYKKFTLPPEVLSGWSGSSYIPSTDKMQFRYEGPPRVEAVRPGVSSVTVELAGVV